MNTFKTWLDANPGMASKLTKALEVNSTSISNAKKGILLIPVRWMPTIVKLSKGEVTLKQLVQERAILQEVKRQERINVNT